ncbi:diaminopimelate epimerase [Thermomonas sp.]|nr:diaminopimelate epimerase [Thermomonas sp.]MBK6416046.1 diaminopimelate epimerase [Thermomonas sp.]MBK6925610.1 diaminopimelate epimerase [Thermomonas sp.]MBK9669888.1 diaminopimelate epimerase [Thermomonas sp.]MBL0228289.1 diaminopimelate epimerase [Thermomonas sp.]MBP7157181.1 diaminopimelate epimerase [Thermomonas sp.]
MRGLKLAFSKMHGAGNDFVVLDLRDGRPAPDPALCARIADRHLGVGCDQLLTVEAPRSADAVAGYRIWNADGSAAGQCGNGARCIAAWLVRDGTAPATAGFAIDSPSATHAVARDADAGFVIDMGTPRFAPQAVPLLGWDAAEDAYALAIDGGTVRFGAVSMGNPHAVIEVAEVAHAPVAAIGAALQRAPAFPQSVNAGFAEVVARDRIRLRVFERGVGETLACGSGACAAVAVLVRGGRIDADREVAVELPGGTLRIRYDRAAERIHMGGPTAFVFEGEW